MTTLISFPLFPTLPTELRQKIWHHALPGPRIIEIEYCEAVSEWFSPVETHIPQSTTLLLVNHESRAEFLLYYEFLCWQRRSGKVTISESACGHVEEGTLNRERDGEKANCWFDKRRDSLYIGPSSEAVACVKEDRIQKLAEMEGVKGLRWLLGCFDEFQWAVSNKILKDGNLEMFEFFPALETFTLVVGDVDTEWMVTRKGTGRPSGLIETETLESKDDADLYESAYGAHMADFVKEAVESMKSLKGEVRIELSQLRRGAVEMRNGWRSNGFLVRWE